MAKDEVAVMILFERRTLKSYAQRIYIELVVPSNASIV